MAFLVNPPCVIFEDDHLLVVNKPAGLNTHSPSPFAGEGIYDWLRHREPRWARLAIIHRLDKETSGVMVFSRTALANRSLTRQFVERRVHKKYLLLTDRIARKPSFAVKSILNRLGERHVSRPAGAEGETAETRFRVVEVKPGRTLIEAEPATGKTHQIRVHAADQGLPILGDTLYGGSPFARVCLHAQELELKHPESGKTLTFTAPADFSADTRLELRSALIGSGEGDAFRLVHGAADGWPRWYVDRLGDYLLSQSERELTGKQREALAGWLRSLCVRGAYHKKLSRHVRGRSAAESSPQNVLGEVAPNEFVVRENGARFVLSFKEGYSVGLFLDQRDNRRRFLSGHVAAGFSLFPAGTRPEVLNAFAYTCGFSVCAAKAGARTTSIDVSKKYLEWGRRNFALNGLEAGQHDFMYGDAFGWLRRFARKRRMFDAIVLDPPTFSQSKAGGVFQAGKDYGELVKAALPLLKPDGVLFASTNAAKVEAEKFLDQLNGAVGSARRKIVQQHYTPQPPDFPVSREEPAYLKTVWMRIR